MAAPFRRQVRKSVYPTYTYIVYAQADSFAWQPCVWQHMCANPNRNPNPNPNPYVGRSISFLYVCLYVLAAFLLLVMAIFLPFGPLKLSM